MPEGYRYGSHAYRRDHKRNRSRVNKSKGNPDYEYGEPNYDSITNPEPYLLVNVGWLRNFFAHYDDIVFRHASVCYTN